MPIERVSTTSALTAMKVMANMAESAKLSHYQLLAFVPDSLWDVLMNMDNEKVGQLIKDQILLITSDGERKPEFQSTKVEETSAAKLLFDETQRYMLLYKTARRTRLAGMKKRLTTAHAPELDDLDKDSRISTRYRRYLDTIDEVVKHAPNMPKIRFAAKPTDK